MPTLNWIGKDSVVRHHKDVPFRLLEPDKKLSHGDPSTGNLIVEGDNLLALKALLPRYAGKVKCICIDPPYNTGNEGWIYNDNVNSPEILRWLGQAVGKEAEDLSRHEKWLTISAPLSPQEAVALQATVQGATSRDVITQAAEASRTQAVTIFTTPSERGIHFEIPRMALHVHGELQLFDDPEVLDYPWDLPLAHAEPSDDALKQFGHADGVRDGGEIDVDQDSGRVKVRFLSELQRDLGLAYRPEHWTEAKLAAWICRNLPDPFTTHASKSAFVAAWLGRLLASGGFDLARANRQKFLLRAVIESDIRFLRKQAVRAAYQQTLFGDGRADRVKVDARHLFEFHPDHYAPDRDYDGRFGEADFKNHYYPRIGDFDSKEEYLCACELEKWASRGRIEFWVRNLVRKPCSSFFLQTAEGRFYPDFICRLPDKTILVVEYKGANLKGANLYAAAHPDRAVGELWAELSEGRCRFVMVTDKKWSSIEPLL